MAAEVIDEAPVEIQEGHEDISGFAGTVVLGGEQTWELCIITIWRLDSGAAVA